MTHRRDPEALGRVYQTRSWGGRYSRSQSSKARRSRAVPEVKQSNLEKEVLGPSPDTFAPDHAPLQLQWYGTDTSILGACPESTSTQAHTPVCPGTPGPASDVPCSCLGIFQCKVQVHTLAPSLCTPALASPAGCSPAGFC
jgi:hypothetical protein